MSQSVGPWEPGNRGHTLSVAHIGKPCPPPMLQVAPSVIVLLLGVGFRKRSFVVVCQIQKKHSWSLRSFAALSTSAVPVTKLHWAPATLSTVWWGNLPASPARQSTKRSLLFPLPVVCWSCARCWFDGPVLPGPRAFCGRTRTYCCNRHKPPEDVLRASWCTPLPICYLYIIGPTEPPLKRQSPDPRISSTPPPQDCSDPCV